MATSHNSFSDNLAFGQEGERLIAKWLIEARNNSVLPACDIENGLQHKGPRLLAMKEIILPDLVVFNKETGACWIEVKRKTAFTWYRIGHQWETGVDKSAWDEYLQIKENTGLPLWILFLHESTNPSQSDINYGCPDKCHAGLFGQDIAKLAKWISHESNDYARGMVYWGVDTLETLATHEELAPYREAKKKVISKKMDAIFDNLWKD